MTDTRRGRFALEYHLVCGACGDWDMLEVDKPMSKKNLRAWAIKEGWKITRRFSWTCPFCLREITNVEKKPLTTAD